MRLSFIQYNRSKSEQIRLISILAAFVLMGALGCEESKPPTKVVDSDYEIDNLIFSLPDISTHTSERIPTQNGYTSSWAGNANAVSMDSSLLKTQDSASIGGELWICEENEREYASVKDKFPLLSENADVIWPGAALQGASLYRATPDPITAPRGPGVIVWSQINGSKLSSVSLSEINLSTVKQAADSLLAAQPVPVPAEVELSITRVRSREELQIAVNASADYFGLFDASASFEFEKDARYNYYLLSLRQNMFSLVFQRPSRPHQFFKDGTDVSLIAPHVGSENPPAYVSVVTYGRMFYLLIRSSESSTTMEATLQANFDLGLFGAELGSSVNYLTSFRNLNMQFYSYGGSSAELPNAIGGGLESLKSFKQALKNGNNFKLAKPVFATIRSVASDELVRNGYNLGFTYRECQSGGKLCSPALLSPQPSATLDNGCTTTSNSIKWAFSWTACENAEEYQIRVTNTTLGTVVDVDGIKVTTYSKSFTSPFTVRTGWKWMVRSKVGGNWGPWSRTSGFSLEPVGTDCPSPRIVLYEHANYGGASITLNKDTPNLDIDALNFADVASSVKLYYIDRVRLYDGANYTGTYIEVAANDTYVGDAFSDRAGSVDFQPFR